MRLVVSAIIGLALWQPAATPARQDGAQGCERHADRVYTMQEVHERARVTRRPPPAFPEAARRRKIKTGNVKLRVVLRPGGKVTDIEVLETTDESFNKTSVEAASKTRFEPAIKAGCPVAQSVILMNSYNLYY